MKKLLCILLAVLIFTSLVSCGGNEPVQSDRDFHTTEEVKSEPTIATPDTSDETDNSTESESDSAEGESLESVTDESEPAESESVSTEVATEESTPAESTESEPQESTPPEPPQVATYVPRVMMYHLIRDELNGVNDSLFVRPYEFEIHLSILNERGYEYIFADEWRYTEKPSVMLTFDDGYVDNYTNMFPILKKYGAKATIFLITGSIDTDGYLTSEMIKEMSASGLVSFQCHTANHYDLSQIDVDTMRSEFKTSSDKIESLTGRDVKALAYPMGMYNYTVISVASEYFEFAYTTDSPFYVKQYTHYTTPRYFVRRGDDRYKFNTYLQ